MLSDPNLLPYIKQTFKHYQIPITVIHENARDASILIAAKLLAYYLEPTDENLFAVLNSELIKHPYLTQLMEYIQLFHGDIHMPFHHIRNQEIKSELISDRDKDWLDRLEAGAEEARIEVLSRLSPILQMCIRDSTKLTHDIDMLNPVTVDVSKDDALFKRQELLFDILTDFGFIIVPCFVAAELSGFIRRHILQVFRLDQIRFKAQYFQTLFHGFPVDLIVTLCLIGIRTDYTGDNTVEHLSLIHICIAVFMPIDRCGRIQ